MSTFWEKEKGVMQKGFSRDENFLRNRDIRRVMHGSFPEVVKQMLGYVNNQELANKVKDPSFGSPSLTDGFSVPTARNLFYRHIMQDFFDIDQINHITDFGGGYGNNCRLWKTLGYSGQFALVDLKEVLEIQKYYLSNVLDDLSNINFYETVHDFKELQSKSLFFATFSLSETSRDVRDSVIPKILDHDYIFIVHNKSFPAEVGGGEINNIDYFAKFKNENSDKFEFINFENKIQMKANYVIGRKR